MKPTHPVELLACAIATEEGWFKRETIPTIRHNPGDLRFAGQLNACRPDGSKDYPLNDGSEEPIAVFSSDATGITGLFRDLWLSVAMGRSVRKIIEAWAPPSQNDTSTYLHNVLTWTGLPADEPLLNLLPPLTALNLPSSTKPIT